MLRGGLSCLLQGAGKGYSLYSLLFRYLKIFHKNLCINGQETMEEIVLQGPVLNCIYLRN